MTAETIQPAGHGAARNTTAAARRRTARAEEVWAQAVHRVRYAWGQHWFDIAAERVLGTAPLAMRGNSPLILSMVCHRDVAAYLLAIKSLYQRMGEGRVVVINDGSLTDEDLKILRHHVPGLTVDAAGQGSTGALFWVRLTKIVELSAAHYVIQLDSDTLVSGPIPEVVSCYRENISFLLGTNVGQEVAPASAAAAMVQGWIETNRWDRLTVGVAAEAALDSLPQASRRSYVHASAGFAGFARGAFRLSELQEFSDWMRRKLGSRWDEWGSEQIASNYILANAPNAVVLPFARYACFEPPMPTAERPFLHFIGSHRFKQGLYRRRVNAFLAGYGTAGR